MGRAKEPPVPHAAQILPGAQPRGRQRVTNPSPAQGPAEIPFSTQTHLGLLFPQTWCSSHTMPGLDKKPKRRRSKVEGWEAGALGWQGRRPLTQPHCGPLSQP